MKKRAGILLFSLLALAGCSNSTETTSTTAASTEKSTGFKVALLTPGSVNDAGWSAMAYRGLQQVKTELQAEVDNQEAKGTQIRDAMRAYAQKDYNLVFGHGFEYNEPAIEVAKDFPNTVFVSSSGGKTASNVGAFRFYLEQGFYLAGYTAGKLTKTNVIGMVGGPDVPSIRSTFKAFRAGALAANPNVKVKEVFTGKDDDIAAAKQAALSIIDLKADFLIHQANRAASGVFDAAKEKGIFAFGANLDQNKESSAVLASAVIKAEGAFSALAKSVQDKSFKGSVVLMGMQQDAIDFVVNPDLISKITPQLKKELDALKADILSGKLVVPKDEF